MDHPQYSESGVLPSIPPHQDVLNSTLFLLKSVELNYARVMARLDYYIERALAYESPGEEYLRDIGLTIIHTKRNLEEVMAHYPQGTDFLRKKMAEAWWTVERLIHDLECGYKNKLLFDGYNALSSQEEIIQAYADRRGESAWLAVADILPFRRLVLSLLGWKPANAGKESLSQKTYVVVEKVLDNTSEMLQ